MTDSAPETDPASTPASTFSVLVNGEEREISAGSTVRDLLLRMEIDPDQSGIAVARQEEVVPRDEWSVTELEAGDRVEVITATRGG